VRDFSCVRKVIRICDISWFEREKVLPAEGYLCNDFENSPVRLPDGSNCEIEVEKQPAQVYPASPSTDAVAM
jgi:hypothetical protein